MIKIKSTFGNFCLIFAKINENETDKNQRVNKIDKNMLNFYIAIYGGSSELTLKRYKKSMKDFGFITLDSNEEVYNIHWKKIKSTTKIYLEANKSDDPQILAFLNCFETIIIKDKKV